MPIKALIITDTPDGVTSQVTHYDGHPGHTGRLLAQHYSTFEMLDALADYGDIAFLASDIGREHNGERRLRMMNHPKWKTWCLFYGRDLKGCKSNPPHRPESMLHRGGLKAALDRAKKEKVNYIYHGKVKWTKREKDGDDHWEKSVAWEYAPVVDGSPERFRRLTMAAPTAMVETSPA